MNNTSNLLKGGGGGLAGGGFSASFSSYLQYISDLLQLLQRQTILKVQSLTEKAFSQMELLFLKF